MTTQVGDRPLASPLARLQAETKSTVTNLLHMEPKLAPLDQVIVRWLDGSRDRLELIRQLEGLRRQGGLPGEASRDDGGPDSAGVNLDELLDQCLERLATFALLMPPV